MTKAINRLPYLLPLWLVVFCALFFSLMPIPASAATAKPTCALVVTTHAGDTKIAKKSEVYFKKGSDVTISWATTGATKLALANGKELPLRGSTTTSPSRSTTFAYKASKSGRSATCAVTLIPVTSEFTSDASVLPTKKAKLAGEVTGATSLRLTVQKQGSTKVEYRSGNLKAKSGLWAVTLPKKLPLGKYTVTLLGASAVEQNIIATTTLTVSKTARSGTGGNTKGVLAATFIPLLAGGTTRVGSTVPVSYLQLTNVGTENLTLNGVWLSERGSLQSELISGLSTIDDTNGSRGVAVGTKNDPLFKDDRALIPIPQTLFLPGQMRLLTIQATLGAPIPSAVGTQMKIDVAGVETNGSVRAALPIRGVTWTVTP